MRRFGFLSCTFILALLVGGPAGAAGGALAPELVSSQPEDGATVHQSPSEVVLQFSEPLDSQSSMVVRDECGARIDDGNVEIFLSEMRVGIATARAGRHKVAYEAVGVGSLTGSTEGGISYTVHMGPSCKKGTAGHGNHRNHGNDDEDHGEHGGRGKDHGVHRGKTGSSAHGGEHDSGGEHSKAHRPKRGKGHGEHHHDAKEVPAEEPSDPAPTVAAGEGPLGGGADGSAVIAALAISAVLGALGGWLLRETAPRS